MSALSRGAGISTSTRRSTHLVRRHVLRRPPAVHQVAEDGLQGGILLEPGPDVGVLGRALDAVSGRWSFEQREVGP